MKSPLMKHFGESIAVILLCATSALQADDSAFTSHGGLASASGEDIYTHICQGCHMPQGQGAVGAGYYPKLALNPKLAAWQYMAVTVLGGRDGMPAFGLPAEQANQTRTLHLSDQQIAEVINYVRSHFGNKYKDKVTAAQVAALPHPTSESASE